MKYHSRAWLCILVLAGPCLAQGGGNVAEIAAKDAPDGDYTPAINAALAQHRMVRLGPMDGCYKISKTLQFSAGSGLEGVPGATICMSAASPSFNVDQTAAGVSIRNVVFNGNSGSKTLGVVRSSGFSFNGGGASQAGSIVFSGASNCVVGSHAQFLDGIATALVLTKNTANCEINGNEFQRNVGFGILLNEGAHANSILHNTTARNGIELVGIQDGAYGNTVSYNHAEGSGDNGISVTGDNNRVTGNEAVKNKLTGIFIYGGNNVVASNTAVANGQAHNPSSFNYNAQDNSKYAGIEVSGAFGGSGYGNVITNNRTDDDQPTPTQAYGTWIGPGYGSWKAGTAYTADRYISSQGSLYKAQRAGVAGKDPPACESGTCSDGELIWVYVKKLPGASPEPKANKLSGNTSQRAILSGFFDSTKEHDNTISTKD